MMEDLIVVGNGMAGVACLEQILKHSPKFRVTVFGDETHANYNRILLSSVLAGERSADDIMINPLAWYQQNHVALRLGVRIVGVDPKRRTIKGDDDSITHYDKLLLATGSKAWIPPIEGVDKENVFTFRNLNDTRGLVHAAGKGVRAVVIGGGLLGLEAARGLQLQGCDVTVVHLMDTLMNMQLDATGGGYLARKMEEIGVRVLTSRKTERLLGNGHVHVDLADGRRLTKRVDYPLGNAKNRLKDSAVEGKFFALVERIIGKDRAEKIIELVWKLDEAKNVDELMQALQVPKKS